MRLHRLLTIGLAVLLIAMSATAQEWIDYASRQDRFAVNLPCAGNGTVAQGVGGWKYDVLGAVDHATQEILMRGSTVTYFAWSAIDRINGGDIHLRNADQSITFVQMHMHENRLYIFEATVPAGAAEPLLFQQSPRFLDADGREVRYSDNYLNLLPAPKREGRGAPAAP